MRWKSPLAILILVCLVGFLTRGLLVPLIGWSLVCRSDASSADAILVENFDENYRLFEQAAVLQQAGLALRVLVPTQTLGHHSREANPVSKGIVEVMAHFARVQNPEIVPIEEIEPYTLNAAFQIRDFLVRERLRSVIAVIPALRSTRSSLVYRAVFGAADIQIHCLPVFDQHTPINWTATWHGVQVVTEQTIKLQFYRFRLLRWFLGGHVG